jgi:hypothetical protein
MGSRKITPEELARKLMIARQSTITRAIAAVEKQILDIHHTKNGMAKKMGLYGTLFDEYVRDLRFNLQKIKYVEKYKCHAPKNLQPGDPL